MTIVALLLALGDVPAAVGKTGDFKDGPVYKITIGPPDINVRERGAVIDSPLAAQQMARRAI